MELTFREIVKFIHPDSNPSVVNPSEKMSEAVLNKSNKRALYNLAIRWGFINARENVNTTVRNSRITITVHSSGWDTGLRPHRRNNYWEV